MQTDPVTINQFALDFARKQCRNQHGRLKAHTCADCQLMMNEVRELASQWELELAKSVLKWWNNSDETAPDFVKIAGEITAYPGKYTTITLIPGWVFRKLKPIILFVLLTLFGMLIAAGIS